MKKIRWKFVILILIAAIFFLWLMKTPLISNYLTRKLRVPISIEWISIGTNETTLSKLKIKNPKGYKTKEAFEAASTKIDYQFKQLISNPVVIDQIFLNDVFLGVEFLEPFGTVNNWTQIGKNMSASKSRKQVIIDKLILTNLKIEIRGIGISGKVITKTVDRLEFDQIDSTKGFPTEELVRKVFGGSGIEEYLQDLFDPTKAIENVLEPFQIFGS